ncbi:MAG TPA: flagellar export chaperone FliS [Fimbriimonas sp.]|nr:flagellar export chaperone FliS [Fimbriimonas sp.]
MSYGKQVQAYRQNAVMSASPVQLVVMLYDGSLRFMEEGKRAIIAKDLATQNAKLQRAQKIVMELMSTLNFNAGGEISKNLLSLYSFVLNELVEGNMNDDPDRIDVAMKTMSELREGWVTIEAQSRNKQEITPSAA